MFSFKYQNIPNNVLTFYNHKNFKSAYGQYTLYHLFKIFLWSKEIDFDDIEIYIIDKDYSLSNTGYKLVWKIPELYIYKKNNKLILKINKLNLSKNSPKISL